MKKDARGLTLIELLIVIAILGVLAAVIIVAINPLEQFARGRDASRKSSTGQLGHALQSFFTASGGITYPTVGGTVTWMQQLVNQGEIQNKVAGPNYTAAGVSPCTTNVDGAAGSTAQYCYTTDVTTQAAAWARMESLQENSKCTAPNVAHWVYSTLLGQSGRWCGPSGSTPPYGPTFTP